MQDDARAKREEIIAEAAYDVLEEKGYSGASMLTIARKARASNETLYNWYGDKLGLFTALILRNSSEVRALLDDGTSSDPLKTLSALGPTLLRLLLGQRAVALNRAAACDATGQLGRALAQSGREAVLPQIGNVLEAARANDDIAFDDLNEALSIYIGLLVGDQQIRRAIGALEEPSKASMTRRARTATSHFLTLHRA